MARSPTPARITPRVATLVLAGVCSLGSVGATTDGMIRVRQMTPAGIESGDPGLWTTESASVSFRLALRYRCTAPKTPRRVFVAVADSFVVEDIEPGSESSREVELAVPAGQLSGLDISSICDQRPDARPVRLKEAFAATASLVCGSETESDGLVSGGTPLDVWVACALPEDESDAGDTTSESPAAESPKG